MTFTVTYREKSGTKAEVEIEAASRAECLAACKARGIAPLGVREGRSVAGQARGGRKLFMLVASVLFVLLLGGVVWWLAARDEVKPPPPPAPKAEMAKQPTASKPKKPKDQKVAEAVPPAKARREPEPVQPTTEVSTPPPKKPQSNAHLLVKDPNARVIPHRPPEPRRFEFDSEEDIASLLEIQPGDVLVGELKFGKRFLEDFKKSLGKKIEILDTDTPEQRELKEAVSATKEDLRRRMEAGEDICKIMADSRRQLQELGAYKLDLMAELHDIRKSGEWSAEEYTRFVEAANKMLESRGATPIKLPRVIVRQLKKQQQSKGQ